MKRSITVALTIGLLGVAAPAAANDATSEFATDHHDCLGPLRSDIAQGEHPELGVTGFSGDFNPGNHLGTRGEAAFLTSAGVAYYCP